MTAFHRWLVSLTLRHRRTLIAVLLVVTAVLGFFASRVDIKTNFKDLLGPNRPVMVAYKALQANYPDASAVFVVIEGNSAEDLVSAGDRMASLLEEDTAWVREVRWKEDMGFFRKYALLLESTKDLTKLSHDLSTHPNLFKDAFLGYSLTDVFRGMNAEFDDYSNVSSVKADENDLIRSMAYTASWLDALTQGFDGSVDPFAIRRTMTDLLDNPDKDSFLRYVDDEGHTISPDGRVALIQVLSKGDANDAVYGTNLTNHLRTLCAQVQGEMPNVQIGLTGFPVVLADEGAAMLDRMGLSFALAIAGILLVFFFSFRRIILPSLAAIPLLVGIVWSIGLVSLSVGELNLFSIMAPVILLGLGIDYGIHIISQFTQSRASGLPLEKALTDVFNKIGRGLAIGALTTAATFFAVIAAGFKGIEEFGVVGGLSVLCAYASMMFILPIILAWSDGWRTRRGKGTVHVPLPVLGRLAEALARRRIVVLVVVILVLVGGGFSMTRLRVEKDVMKIEPKGLESIRLQDRVLDAFDFSIYATYGMLDSVSAVQRAATKLDTLPTVRRTDSLASVLPSHSEQEIRRELIAQIEPGLRAAKPDSDTTLDPGALSDALSSYADTLFQMKSMAYLGGMTRLVDGIAAAETKLDGTRAALDQAGSDSLSALNEVIVDKMKLEYTTMIGALDHLQVTQDDVPSAYLERYKGKDGSYLVTVYPTESPWISGFAEQHLSEVQSVLKTPTGIVPIWTEVLEQMIPGFLRASAVALAVLSLLLLIDLRSVRRTVLVLVPLLLSLVTTLALIPVLGMKINVVDLMAFPLILGIGIDDGVHLYHRYLIERSLHRTFSSTGKAIVATTLTTVAALLTIGLSPHRGLMSFAWVSAIGISLCLVFNVLILPGLMRTFDRPKKLVSHDKRSIR